MVIGELGLPLEPAVSPVVEGLKLTPGFATDLHQTYTRLTPGFATIRPHQMVVQLVLALPLKVLLATRKHVQMVNTYFKVKKFY